MKLWNKDIGWFDPQTYTVHLDKEGIGWVDPLHKWVLMQDYSIKSFDQLTPEARQLAEAVAVRGLRFFEQNNWNTTEMRNQGAQQDLLNQQYTGPESPTEEQMGQGGQFSGMKQPPDSPLPGDLGTPPPGYVSNDPVVASDPGGAGGLPANDSKDSKTMEKWAYPGTPETNKSRLTYNEFARAVAEVKSREGEMKPGWNVPNVAEAIESGGALTEDEKKSLQTPWLHLVGTRGLDGRILDENDAIAAARDSYIAGIRDYEASKKSGQAKGTVTIPGVGVVPIEIVARAIEQVESGRPNRGQPTGYPGMSERVWSEGMPDDLVGGQPGRTGYEDGGVPSPEGRSGLQIEAPGIPINLPYTGRDNTLTEAPGAPPPGVPPEIAAQWSSDNDPTRYANSSNWSSYLGNPGGKLALSRENYFFPSEELPQYIKAGSEPGRRGAPSTGTTFADMVDMNDPKVQAVLRELGYIK